MQQIRPWLFIGSYEETADRQALDAAGISAMLQLAAPREQAGIETLFVRVDDAALLPGKNIKQGVDFVRAQKSAGHSVLIACRQGISRSSAFAIAALAEEEELSLQVAHQIVSEAHPQARPHPSLLISLMHYYDDKSIMQEG